MLAEGFGYLKIGVLFPFMDVILLYVISVRLMYCLINLMTLNIILEV